VPGSSIFSCERRAVVTQVGEKERTEDRVCACMCVHVLFSISLCSNPPLFICFILISVPSFFFFLCYGLQRGVWLCVRVRMCDSPLHLYHLLPSLYKFTPLVFPFLFFVSGCLDSP
jgi:hypothetical protein